MPITGTWYITLRAVEDYLRLTGRDPDAADDTWDSAEEELRELAAEAHYVKTLDSGAEVWRGKRPLRLTFHVTLGARTEGDAPQLVRVLGESQRTSNASVRARRVTIWDGAKSRTVDVVQEVNDPGPDRRVAYRLATGAWVHGYRGRVRPDHVERLTETVSPPEWVLRLAGKASRRGRR